MDDKEKEERIVRALSGLHGHRRLGRAMVRPIVPIGSPTQELPPCHTCGGSSVNELCERIGMLVGDGKECWHPIGSLLVIDERQEDEPVVV